MYASSQFKVLILDDSIQEVRLIKRVLNNARLHFVSKVVNTRHGFVKALTVFKPDIILANYFLSAFNGMHAFYLSRQQKPNATFILMAQKSNSRLASECLNEGIDGFVLKPNYKTLPVIIMQYAETRKAERVQASITSQLELKHGEIRELRSEIEKAKLLRLLSKRELEIFHLLASGRSIKEIAGQLFLSPSTIATYRARLLVKLNLKSIIELIHYALRNNLIDLG
jgi:DNA-binding NarL/FixJ family response regulator